MKYITARPINIFIACVLIIFVLALPWELLYAMFPTTFPTGPLSGFYLFLQSFEFIRVGVLEGDSIRFQAFFMYSGVTLWVFVVYLLVSAVRLTKKASFHGVISPLLWFGLLSHLMVTFLRLSFTDIFEGIGFWCAFAVYFVLFRVEATYQNTYSPLHS